MFKIIAIAVLVVIIAILVFATTKPDTFRVERTTTIKAPPEKIYPLINDFHSWTTWSPYEKKDPDMKRTHSGAASGQGAVYEWDGDKNVGKGRMEITESSPASRIVIKLDFLAPFEAHNTAEFTLQPQGDATQVTWSMYGPANYMSKLMSVFFNMDKMVGDDFAIGLANLKAAAEQ
ncbi:MULTISPECIES: SRPBCC family protein [Oxalobacteraceae]|uniref:SRPBCC family protein n=1 Tax=Herminiimonas contaminans TaxID=1111140 RepID=A0ABS0EV50_9BURK|nr:MULTISPECIES: SRPBCC family protein [Oxalobacteraceae]MBF8178710.1 SRPBCC family protein [Herminiimonas contaminans]